MTARRGGKDCCSRFQVQEEELTSLGVATVGFISAERGAATVEGGHGLRGGSEALQSVKRRSRLSNGAGSRSVEEKAIGHREKRAAAKLRGSRRDASGVARWYPGQEVVVD